MSIFGKATSAVKIDDLQELLTERAVENVRLEFKSEIPNKDETLKKLSSFANTFGGYLVVGARGGSDGRLGELCGVEPKPNYKQTIMQWCFEGAAPPLTAEVSDPIRLSPERVAYVISVAESDVAPHFLNGRKGVWVRTDEFSSKFEQQLATERELRQLFDRRKIIEHRREALIERAHVRFTRHATDLAGAPDAKAGLTLAVVPRFPSSTLCSLEDLPEIVTKSETYWRGDRFPRHLRESLVTQHESVVLLQPGRLSASIFEASIWGSLFYGAVIEGPHDNNSSGIHVGEFAGTILLFLRHAAIMFKSLGYSGWLVFEVGLAGVRGTRWLYDAGGWLEARAGSALDDSIRFSVEQTSDVLLSSSDEVASSILRVAMFSMGWRGAVDSPSKIQSLIANGYTFNSWERPVSPKPLRTAN